MASRRCSRQGCAAPAIATLTYVYADSTAVLGPLATQAEPHTYDLCSGHADRLTAPRGWEVVRLQPEAYEHRHTHDDLLALADAVREAARPLPEPVVVVAEESSRRGHLRVLRSAPAPGAGGDRPSDGRTPPERSGDDRAARGHDED